MVYKLVYSPGVLASCFGPAIILSLLWKRTEKKAVIIGMIFGVVSSIIWHSNSYLNSIWVITCLYDKYVNDLFFKHDR